MVIPSLEAFIFATTSVLVTGVKLSSEVVMLGSLSTFKVPAVISAAFNVPLIVAFWNSALPSGLICQPAEPEE